MTKTERPRPSKRLAEPQSVWHLEPRYTLAEAARLFFPGGRITARSLRTEITKGRLRVEIVAGKVMVTESALEAMLELCRVPTAHRKSED